MENKRILVVEDDEMNMELVGALLKLGKYQMLEAEDAETGIQMARDHQPDLILIDIQLPWMDGLSATRIIKEDPELKEIPVVALTAYAMQEDEEKAKNAGCSGYITKPIDVKHFLERIAGYMA
jgi:CheY-like chemotaxis protein